MNDIATPLQDLRDQIDSIDNELIALLKKRIGVVSQVGQLKKQAGEKGVFIRPGREGRMHQRIYDAFKGSDIPAEAALQIWRLLISASTHYESPLKLAVMHSTEEDSLYCLAREYFGSFLETKSYTNAGSLLSDLWDNKCNIGILPYPQDESSWWHILAQYQEPRLHIFARLPLIAARPHRNAALAVAHVTPEPSDDDESYFVVQAEETVSTSRLHTLFQQAGLKPDFINSFNQPPLRALLVRLDGYFDPSHPAIEALTANLEQAELRWLGAHPKAIAL